MTKKSPTTKPRPRKTDDLVQHRHWLKRAEDMARSPVNAGGSPHPTVKVGAVLVNSKGREIAAASNRFAAGRNVTRTAPNPFG